MARAALSAGDAAAAQQLWQRYLERLIRLASRKLGDLPRRVANEEDVVLSAFHDFLRGLEDGRFSRLVDRQDLSQVLVMLTERKAIGVRRQVQAGKRGGGHLRRESVLEAQAALSRVAPGIGQLAGCEPTPQFAAEVHEEFSRAREATTRTDWAVRDSAPFGSRRFRGRVSGARSRPGSSLQRRVLPCLF